MYIMLNIRNSKTQVRVLRSVSYIRGQKSVAEEALKSGDAISLRGVDVSIVEASTVAPVA